MPSKSNLYMCQFSHLYGDNIYLPYSAGVVWAYARTIPEIEQNYDMKKWIFVRDDPDEIVDSLEDPAVVTFSTYVWNWEMSAVVAKKVKERYPDCLIVFGGPQVPGPDRFQFYDYPDAFPYIDISVHGEGEMTFAHVLQENLNGRDFANVPGITYKGVTTEKRERTKDLDQFPSPYLEGVFEELFELPYNFNTIFETNRGCPYGCTFCDWGSLTAQKMFNFSLDRIYAEIDYFAEKKIDHVFSADANFGILERDIDIARYLADTKRKSGGYPEKLRVNYAKNSTQRVFDLAKILNDEGLDKGITLSVQSMDKNTLNVIKRRNLKFDTYKGFMKMYEQAGIDGYTEVIMALPGETYETFRAGVDELLDASTHDSLWIYRCSLLPNAPMNEPNYRALHKIKTVRTPIYLNHTTPGFDPVQEYEDTVIGTATQSTEDVIRCNTMAWAIQGFHGLNLTQVLACYARAAGGVQYTTFYEKLMEFGQQNPETLVGSEFLRTRQQIVDVFENGGNWDNVQPDFLSQTWATEEASFLACSRELDRFYQEVEQFLDYLEAEGILAIEPELRADLLRYQKALVVKWEYDGTKEFELSHSVHSFYHTVLLDQDEPVMRQGKFRISVADPFKFNGDKAEYATRIVWWGRRGGLTVYTQVEEAEIGAPIPEAATGVDRASAIS